MIDNMGGTSLMSSEASQDETQEELQQVFRAFSLNFIKKILTFSIFVQFM